MTGEPTSRPLGRELERLRERTAALEDRVTELETECERKDERIDELETTVQRLEDETDCLEQRVTDCESKTTRADRAADAALKKSNANKDRIRELQARELEKGAHLRTDTVDPHEIAVAGDRLEKITKDDGETYYRIPDSSDPLDHAKNATTLAHGDLLPIQQLARLDEEMLRSTTNALPTRLAAKLWRARTDPTVGDDPWQRGSKSVREYVKASDLKHWIRRQEPGTSEAYAKKLVSRTIDALQDLTNHRIAIRRRTERKNGLEYTERRVILPADAEIPGECATETASSETPDVTG